MGKELSKSGKDGPPLRGPEYLVPHACFVCRKSWKRPGTKYIGDDDRRFRCPECNEVLHFMGRYFRVPKRTDVKEWAKVEKLRKAGYVFSTGTYQWESFPEDLREVDEWIARNPRHRNREQKFWPGASGASEE